MTKAEQTRLTAWRLRVLRQAAERSGRRGLHKRNLPSAAEPSNVIRQWTTPNVRFAQGVRGQSAPAWIEGKMVNRISIFVALPAFVLACFCSNAWTQDAPPSFELQNGFLPQKQFDAAKQAFEEVQTTTTGLGIHFNETSCAHCHLAPPGGRRLPGGSGPITELRAGYLARNNEFVPAPD